MKRPSLPDYNLTKSERNKFSRQCHAWDLAFRLKDDEPTETDIRQAYSVLSYVGRLANLEYRNSINDNTASVYKTSEHQNSLLRAEKARYKARQMLAPYKADIVYFGCMPTVVEINTNRDLYVGHW